MKKTLAIGVFALFLMYSCSTVPETSTDEQTVGPDTSVVIDVSAGDSSAIETTSKTLEVGQTLSEQEIKAKLVEKIPEKHLGKNKKLTVSGTLVPAPETTAENHVLVIDANGKILAKTPLLNNTFQFEKLPSDAYGLILEQDVPNVVIKFNVQVADSGEMVLGENTTETKKAIEKTTTTEIGTVLDAPFIQKNFLLQIPKSMSKRDGFALKGTLANETNPKQNIENIEILLVNANGKIVRKTKSNGKGEFKFEKLAADDYKLLVNNKDPNLKAKIMEQSDEVMLITASAVEKATPAALEVNNTFPNDLLQKNTLKTISANSFRGKNRDVNGYVEAPNGFPAKNTELYFVNDQNKIIVKAQTDAHGKFTVTKLPASDYSIASKESLAGYKIRLALAGLDAMQDY